MKEYIKHKPIMVSCLLFSICLAVRFIEYFVTQTDKTVLGENLFHKILGIVLIAIVLNAAQLKWNEIGFKKGNSVRDFLKGFLFGAMCFAFSYAIEIAILNIQSNTAHLELYTTGFSITGLQNKNTGVLFFILCIVFNIINVWMEEGLFRGLIIKIISNKASFAKANLISALLFGIWHFVMPIRSCIEGDMDFTGMILLSIGYVILSGLMSIKWGLLYHMSGNLWIGVADHLFNNAVATNMLHVVSNSGADEMQIIRIALAQIISLIFVVVFYFRKNKSFSKNVKELG